VRASGVARPHHLIPLTGNNMDELDVSPLWGRQTPIYGEPVRMKYDRNTGIWHPDASRHPGYGLRKGVLDKRDTTDIKRIIIHHTGVGILGRFKRDRERLGWHDPLQAAVHVYQHIMKASGHYVVGHHGELAQFVPDDWSAWHAGYGNKRKRNRMLAAYDRWRYDRKDSRDEPVWFKWKKGRYEWWQDRWFSTKGYASPAVWFPDLDVNRATLGIEMLAVPMASTAYPDDQLLAVRHLVHGLCGKYDIPIDEDHILTHSDAVPKARTSKRGNPYDPPPKLYKFEEMFG